jgi:hypothetical protein
MPRRFLGALVSASLACAAQIRPVDRAPAATEKATFRPGGFALYLNPAEQKYTEVSPGVYSLQFKSGTVVEIRVAVAPATSSGLKRAFLEGLRKKDPSAYVRDSEARSANGVEFLFVEFGYDEGGPKEAICSFYGGPGGSIALLLEPALHHGSQVRRNFNALLGGLELPKTTPK